MWLAWEEKRNDYRVLARKREGTPDVHGRIIIKRILTKYDGVSRAGLIWLRIGIFCGFL